MISYHKQETFDHVKLFEYIHADSHFSEGYVISFELPGLVTFEFTGGLVIGVNVEILVLYSKKEDIVKEQYKQMAKGIILSVKDQLDILKSKAVEENKNEINQKTNTKKNKSSTRTSNTI